MDAHRPRRRRQARRPATLPRGLTDTPKGGRFGVGREVSKGKDTPSGHWEIAGVPVPFAWGYFPQTIPTFPPELIEALIAQRRACPASSATSMPRATDIIAELGEESIRTGKPICYTSIDSVFQIAAQRRRISASSGSTRSARRRSS